MAKSKQAEKQKTEKQTSRKPKKTEKQTSRKAKKTEKQTSKKAKKQKSSIAEKEISQKYPETCKNKLSKSMVPMLYTNHVSMLYTDLLMSVSDLKWQASF